METINKSELVSIRDFKTEDNNFVYETWLKGLYYGDNWYSETPKGIFMHHYHAVVEFILRKPGTVIKIACLKEDPDTILGYSVFANSDLHWVFVRKSWRNIGLAKDLSPADIKTATHMTKVGLSIIKKKGWVFNPFAV